jgi:Rho termination factor-like protein
MLSDRERIEQREGASVSSTTDFVGQSQAAIIDAVRTWTGIGQQLSRSVTLPVVGVDVAGVVDRAFDVAEQLLGAQRELALALVGAATRQVDTAVEVAESGVREGLRVVEEPVDLAVEDEQERSVEELRERARELEIEGRSAMSKDELIAALRQHSR